MIEVKFTESGKAIAGFSVSGHAGYGDYGSDVVCASVTSAVQMAANGVTECCGVTADVRVEENEISLKLPKGSFGDQSVQRLLAALKLQLQVLCEDYPGTMDIVVLEV